MNKSEQAALSLVYIAPQFVVVPVPEGMALFRCRGAARSLVGIFLTPEGLSTQLRADFHEAELEHQRKAERRASLEIDLSDLDLEL